MIIAIDASRANLQNRTGTEWYSYYLIQEFKKLATNDQFVLYSRENLKGDLAELPPDFESRILNWPLKLLWTQIRLSWETLFHPSDVLFIPAHTIPVLGRAKTVMTVHDVGFRAHPELYSWIDIFYHRFSIWWASRFAWRIICPSEFTKKELIKYYKTDPNKVFVIPHGIETGGEDAVNPAKKNFLLYIGRLENKKNILGILRAFDMLAHNRSDLKLILAGQAGYGMDKIENFIRDKNLRNKIEIRGYITEAEKIELYKTAQAFVFPTFYEGFGMPILEAQSYGCPVITSNRGANAEVAGDSAALVDPHNPSDTAEAMKKILDQKDYQQDLVAAGYQNIKKYSWREAARKSFVVLTKQ